MSETKAVPSKFPDVYPMTQSPRKESEVEPFSSNSLQPNSREAVWDMLLQERQETMRRRDLFGMTHRALIVIALGALAIVGISYMTLFILVGIYILFQSWVTQEWLAKTQLRAIEKVLIGQDEDADRFIKWKWDLHINRLPISMWFIMRYEPYVWMVLTLVVTAVGFFFFFRSKP